MRRIGIAIVMASAFGLVGAQGASAATIPATCATLQTAINNANTGDVIQLTGVCNPSSSNSNFTVSNVHSFTLEGASTNSNGTPADGFDGARQDAPIIQSSGAVSMTIHNLLFENNNIDANDGAALDLQGAVTITNDVFKNNTNASCDTCRGGAVFLDNDSSTTNSLTITGSTFMGNAADQGGAATVDGNGPISITHNTFKDNSVPFTSNNAAYPDGGALSVENLHGPSTAAVTVSDNTFGGSGQTDGNLAPAWGGAVYASLSGGQGSGPVQTLTLDRNKFVGNAVTGGLSNDELGGAVAFEPQSGQYGFNVVQSHNLFQDNGVAGTVSTPSGFLAGGGAEWGTATSITSTADTFIDNHVIRGGSNPAPEGGGVGVIGYVASVHSYEDTPLGSSFTGRDDLFMDNQVTPANGWGGAIYTGVAPGIDCNDTTCPPSHLALYDSTLTGNSVNSTNGEGAAIWGASHDTLTMDNTIVFGNKGVPGAPEIFGYSNPSYSFDDACTTSGGTTPLAGSGNICSDPKLTSSGAETSNSPTIDQGSNALVPSGLTTDIAGRKRITEGKPSTCRAIVDMGAFESKAVKPAPACHPVPVDVTKPTIHGLPKAGQTLSCSHGSWTHNPTGYKYQWNRSGNPIPGANSSTYTVTKKDQGHNLTCTVKAFNQNGTGKPATSAAAHVAKPTPTKKPKHHHGFTG
jgi:hypothetical protein